MIKIDVRVATAPPQKPAARGTVSAYLKLKDGAAVLFAVDEKGKVARIAQLEGDGILHLRPDNDFLTGIDTDDDGYIETMYDDTDVQLQAPQAQVGGNIDLAAVRAAAQALVDALG